MKYLFSNGGGVNSHALLIHLKRERPEVFASMSIVFADTNGEVPETYAALERCQKWLEAHGQNLIRVSAGSLEEHCLREGINPMRKYKWCTDKFKIRPINKWADENLGLPRTKILGIAADEEHRARHASQIEGETNWYPLVQAGITRSDCLKLIESEGFDAVPKSGCFYCPLARVGYFKWLKKAHPDLFDRAVAMEACGQPLKHKFLVDIVGLDDKQGELFEDLARECESGYCFT